MGRHTVIQVTNKITNETKVYNTIRTCADEMSYDPSRISQVLTKEPTRGFLCNYKFVVLKDCRKSRQ